MVGFLLCSKPKAFFFAYINDASFLNMFLNILIIIFMLLLLLLFFVENIMFTPVSNDRLHK